MGARRSTSGTATEHGAPRAMLLGLFLLGCAGTGAELLLLEHYETWRQWLPLAALGLGLVGGGAVGLRPGKRSFAAFRALMAAFAIVGLAGLYLHYVGNAEFELEMYPELGGLDLVWEALRGATPALAPGTMVGLGALGFLFTYHHPASGGTRRREPKASPPDDPEDPRERDQDEGGER